MEIGVHILVKGLVQGVGFRYFVYRKATALGLRGVVRNLMNGDVEVEAEGERPLIEELIQSLKVGPRAAIVNDIRVEWRNSSGTFRGFTIE
jgi:acylphosphatase